MRFLIILPMLACFSPDVSAHHARAAAYDDSVVKQIEGEITAVVWRNPHLRIKLNRVGDDGELETWDLEGGGINIIQRLGVSRNDFAIGDRIRVAGSPGRNGQKTMFIANALLADGREIFLLPTTKPIWTNTPVQQVAIAAERVAAATRSAAGIFRVWGNLQYPETEMALTDDARRKKESWDPLRDDTALRCIPQGMPGVMQNPYPIEFIDHGDSITLKVEEWGTQRTIHLDERSAGGQASALGFSRGRWEGNSLVVETGNVNWPFFDDLGTPQSTAVKIIERFTLSEDETRLDYGGIVADIATFVVPAKMSGGFWQWIPGEEVKPYQCNLQ